MKSKELLEMSLMGAVTEYAHSQEDENFDVVVQISCKDGRSDSNASENEQLSLF